MVEDPGAGPSTWIAVDCLRTILIIISTTQIAHMSRTVRCVWEAHTSFPSVSPKAIMFGRTLGVQGPDQKHGRKCYHKNDTDWKSSKSSRTSSTVAGKNLEPHLLGTTQGASGHYSGAVKLARPDTDTFGAPFSS